MSRWLRRVPLAEAAPEASPTRPGFVPGAVAVEPAAALAIGGSGAAGIAADAPATEETRAAPSAPAIAPEVLRRGLVAWMLGVSAADAAATAAPPPSVAAGLFERLDQVAASESLRAALLPRAPHVVPQLMKTLRDDAYSSADVASRISKDAVLTAEVIRSATSAFRRSEDEGEASLAWAVAAIGTQGLRRAIASVVLRPIFDARGNTLSSRAATQIWKDADRKAKLCAAFAAHVALDPFDGYLAGLLHNTGWTALLRAIDGFDDLRVVPAALAHADLVPPLLRRRDALFGALVGPWKLSPAVDLLAAEVGQGGIDAARSPLGQALRDAERLSTLHALAPPGQRPSAAVPDWSALPRPVQACYSGLSRA